MEDSNSSTDDGPPSPPTASTAIGNYGPANPSVDGVEGTVIFKFLQRKIIRNGNRIVKINKRGIKPSEVEAMRFIRQHTTIPVPEVYTTTPTSITMDFVEGTRLEEAWNQLSESEIAAVSAQLRDYLDQMRRIKGPYIGAFGGGPAVDSRLFVAEGGPFNTEAEWNDFLLSDLSHACPAPVRSMVQSQLRTDHDIVFTHGDLCALNILVYQGRIVAVLDWEYAGFYPEYLELFKPLRGPDWNVGYYETLFNIFPRRYDAEYLADQLISRITRH